MADRISQKIAFPSVRKADFRLLDSNRSYRFGQKNVLQKKAIAQPSRLSHKQIEAATKPQDGAKNDIINTKNLFSLGAGIGLLLGSVTHNAASSSGDALTVKQAIAETEKFVGGLFGKMERLNDLAYTSTYQDFEGFRLQMEGSVYFEQAARFYQQIQKFKSEVMIKIPDIGLKYNSERGFFMQNIENGLEFKEYLDLRLGKFQSEMKRIVDSVHAGSGDLLEKDVSYIDDVMLNSAEFSRNITQEKFDILFDEGLGLKHNMEYFYFVLKPIFEMGKRIT